MMWSSEPILPKHESRIQELERRLFDRPVPMSVLKAAYADPACGGFVVVDGDVQAYLLFHATPKKIVVDRIGVSEKYAGSGMDHCLVDRLIRQAGTWKTVIVLDVAESNIDLQNFAKDKDFVCVKIVRYGSPEKVFYRMVHNPRGLPRTLFIQRRSLIEQSIGGRSKIK